MLEQPASQLYETLIAKRQFFIDRGEDGSSITIPSLFPREGYLNSENFVKPWSGVGAKAVNGLSSRLLISLFPPSSQFVRLILSKKGKEIVKQKFSSPDAESLIEGGLFDMEKAIQTAIETEGFRPPISEIIKHLVVIGNACMYLTDKKDAPLTFFPLSQYVVERDPEDNILTLVIKETISNKILAEIDGVDATKIKEANSVEGTSDLYTKVWLSAKGKYKVHQEVNDEIVPGSEGSYTEETLPYRPLRWITVKGEAYGRGHVEDYIGSFANIDILSRGIVQAAIASSRITPLVNPNGLTDPKDINDAENGEAVYGLPADVSYLKVDKAADLSIAAAQLAIETRTVEAAFLLTGASVRDAERVTAEEIRLLQQELATALGGVFAVLSQEFQLPVVKKLLVRLVKSGDVLGIPKELKPHIRLAVVTGIASLGRTEDLQRISTALGVLQNMLGPQLLAQYTNPSALIDYVLTSAGVTIEGLIKTAEQLQREQQEEAQRRAAQTLLEQGARPQVEANLRAQEQQPPESEPQP